MVTFVGIHYKEGMKALDSRTRTGRKIDDVIRRLNCECLKCNLFQGLEIPKDEEREVQREMFKTIIPDKGILVLLGGNVKKYFPYSDFQKATIITHRHPSFSKASFAAELAEKILKAI